MMNQLRTSAERSYRVGRAAADFAVTAGNTSRQNGVGVVKGSADVALKYRTLKAEVGFGTNPVEEKLFRLAGDTATVSGMVLSAVALPAMARKAATSFSELTTLLEDPTATATARLDKLEEMTRAGAGTIFSAQGVVVGARGAVGILSRSEGIARVAARVGESPLVGALGKPFSLLFKVLLPVADAAVLVGEAIATRRAFMDPQASGWHKARKVLDLGLATLKAAFWLLPAARPLRAAYAVASFAQLVLTLRDFWPTVKPALASAARGTAWAVTHPGEALKAAGEGIRSGLRSVAGGVAAAARAVWGVVAHPTVAWEASRRFLGRIQGLLGKDPAPTPTPGATVPLLPGPAPTSTVAAAPGALGPVPAPAPLTLDAVGPVALPVTPPAVPPTVDAVSPVAPPVPPAVPPTLDAVSPPPPPAVPPAPEAVTTVPGFEPDPAPVAPLVLPASEPVPLPAALG